MADDFSWVAPATKNIANLFGLNPEAAAKGKHLQAEVDYLAARTENTKSDTALNPFKQKAIEGQANNYNAGAEAHRAQAGKYNAETEGLGITNTARRSLAQAIANGAIVQNQDGSMTISPAAVNNVGGALAAMDANPKTTMEGIRGLLGNAAQTPRAAAQTRGVAAAFEPNASFNDQQGQQIMAAKAAAAQNTAVEAAKARGIAAAIAKGQTGPDQQELNRQAQGIKLGADWAKQVPWKGGYLNDEQALQLSQAARASNPGLNPQDAIVKYVNDNPGLLEKKGNWFSKDEVTIKGGIPTTVPAAPMAAPVAPSAPAAAPVPAAPAAAPAAQGGTMTKEKFASMPEGGSVVLNGVTYVKQGRQLVPVK